VTICGLFEAVSMMFNIPLRGPEAVGIHVMEAVQLCPGFSVVQVSEICWKSVPPFCPVGTNPEMFIWELPVFVNVTICGGGAGTATPTI
jgi:hypothetical protein